jgi:alpha-amylase
MQAFYWDCPREEMQEFGWWKFLIPQLDELKQAGITALWLPPASKGANIGGMSMGYDVYDYYDLGKFPQKATRNVNGKDEKRTWFGSESELRELIDAAHERDLQVYADLVLNHNNGADGQELNPIAQQNRWTKFSPQSGRFTRDWTCFNPSPYTEGAVVTFGDMPDLCHINPRVSTNILNYAKWLVEEIGFDGFRYDFVKGFGGWIVRAIHDRTYRRDGKEVDIYGVGECWDGDNFIDTWLDSVNKWAARRSGAFDFPLRYRLKDLCDGSSFSLHRLADGGVLVVDRPFEAVTFVDNHDFRNGDEIVNDKMLAYAYILTHEGYPCVYWKDWFRYGLAEIGQPSGIEQLVRVHENHANGDASIVYVDDTLYVMERTGHEGKAGLLFALNSSGGTRKQWVKIGRPNATLKPVAWRAKDAVVNPQEIRTDADGWCEVEAPQRGYVVYV